ncbi:TRAP transporter small permease subunit [Phaeobacter gallaeciensis]|uniref:TRAP transporter small permease subunit n=1 Tax=Phaeobacter gallaeciensis TaxID=60890 RepID=UPI00237F86D9|nr:TRAP transporter small permease subunit [Phaeobacter gallaeciensis]MDE4097781.1 TRAP transporter small permease subunit [Phaeobacter gallaeciensis]MDE4106381.1 TRAP transporter small permease subunit [Phaeobacter gallaeciensis]MDE4111045.1 TRAP transporter small permease subunit [Phaeobacter gallaeciensis]MDE4115306.1 TRAP transporter small permease subunit [Phaeobacter gallaeciensis]MDE4119776.1 TRAP transporter small permease subunit [Phaeobacter gallaeciensis]
MPSLDVTLPHWAYWVGLIVFPLVAMVLARRPRTGPSKYTNALGYFILVTGGMLGLHRFYLRSLMGLAFIPVFILILISNSNGQEARSVLSDASNVVRQAERTLERETGRIEAAEADLPKMRADLAEAEEGTFAKRRAEKNIARAEQRLSDGRERIAQATEDLKTATPALEVAGDNLAFWNKVGAYALYVLLAAMLVDAVLMPGLVRRANQNLPEEEPESEAEKALRELEEAENVEDSSHVSTGWTGWIDRTSLMAGEFVSYWAVIAVFVYYFEVISRYVFGSPTNWAHEAMYLMFGMQYLIAGSYAMLTEAHVRVDIFYAPLSRPKRAWADLFTSIFFFIFAFTLLFTGYKFALDANAVATGNGVISEWARGNIGFGEMLGSMSLAQWTDPNIRWGEISFNEWEIPLWPMKWVMVIGGLLLVLQGISKLAQDVRAIVKGA